MRWARSTKERDPMPMMDLTYPTGALSAEARATIGDELTTVLLRAERAPDTQLFRDITWLFVHELPASDVVTAGRPAPAPVFRLQVTVPEGALSDRRKQELVGEATRVILDAAGLTEADGMRVWVLIGEVPDGNWGAAGNVIQFAQLRAMAAAKRAGAEHAGAGAPTGAVA
jgi:phenylpyruvate tautomerase PptA (4-oxalocrotonate tautomerase family)